MIEEHMDPDWMRHTFKANIVNIGVPFLRIV